jgi:RNA polymerase sigma-70 factor (ECF subfamily)
MQGAEAIALERAQDGDTEAFRMLVEQHSKQMFRLAYRMTGNEHDAEDVVQETFLRAYGQLDRYESRAHFASWLHRIAANYAIDLLRRRKRWRSTDLDTHEEHAPLQSVEPDPDRSLRGTEVGQCVAEELKKLTAKERIAFTLRHFEGHSIQEISSITGSGISATKNHIFRAVRKMRKALEPMVGQA